MSCRTRPGCAATRIARRRADGGAARRFARVAGATIALALAACLSTEEQNRVFSHRASSKAYYDAGDFARAEDQCRRGLALDEDDATLQLTLGYSLLMQSDQRKLAEAAAVFDDLQPLFGQRDWRVELGAGMTSMQLARARAESEDPAVAADVPGLRAKARAALERAIELTRERNDTPSEISYHLALLDLEEGRLDDFRAHAGIALARLQMEQVPLRAQLQQQLVESTRQRIERDHAISCGRGRRLARELARVTWDAGEWSASADALTKLESFGELDRADWFSRARAREKLGDDEGAVHDYQEFVKLSADRVDDSVGRAITSLTQLRARLAEKRTAQPPGGR